MLKGLSRVYIEVTQKYVVSCLLEEQREHFSVAREKSRVVETDSQKSKSPILPAKQGENKANIQAKGGLPEGSQNFPGNFARKEPSRRLSQFLYFLFLFFLTVCIPPKNKKKYLERNILEYTRTRENHK